MSTEFIGSLRRVRQCNETRSTQHFVFTDNESPAD